jgi:Uma2 family endonuclease
MVIQPKTKMTAEEFEQFIMLPENVDRNFELIGGEIYEVVSNNYSSQVAGRLTVYVGGFIIQYDLGHFTVADGGYKVSGEDYMPDFAFISKARQPKPSHDTYNPLAPDLAIEVLSPTDSEKKLTNKVANYLAAGTVVWAVYPNDKEVSIYTPNQPVKTFGINDTLEGGSVLPGFKLAVRDIFPAEEE